jgi:pilus assembly protein CpaB
MRDQTCPVVRPAGNDQFWPPRAMAKNIKVIRYGLLGIILLLLAVNWGPFSGKGKLNLGGDDMVALLVADQYIPAFAIVKEKMVTVRFFPKDFVPPGALHEIHDLLSDDHRELYITAVAIPEGQPLTHTVIEELGKSRGMASILPPGKVAVSFAADPVRGAGGWVEPGDTIAIFDTTLETDKGGSQHNTRLLFSTMAVLAIDKSRLGLPRSVPASDDLQANPEPGPTVITVVANPPEAARLVEAREQGRLSVVLRSLGDDIPWTGL